MGTGNRYRFVPAVTIMLCSIFTVPAAGQTVVERLDMLREYYETPGNAFHYSTDGMETFDFELPYLSDIFVEGLRVIFDGRLAQVVNEKYEPYPEEKTYPYYRQRLIRTRLSSVDATEYFIDFDAGFSVDPGFVISRATLGKTTYLQMAGGTECMIPGDGYIYIHGHANSMYDVRRRYRYDIETEALIEDPQQLYYVGMKTETLQDITLTGIPESSGTTLRIAKAEPVMVLAADSDRYLVLTETGLTGWINIPSGYESPIKHLFYRGD